MDNIFSGLESMGLGGMGDLDLFGDGKKKAAEKLEKKPEQAVVVNEEDFILDRNCTCPLCDSVFKAKTVKTGKTKLLSQDVDLRPRYSYIDTLKYDVIACPICGYAALTKNFPLIGSAQGKLVKEKISASFTGFGPEKPLYSYDDAIARHKLALVNAVVKRGKTSERAYLCLKLAWLLRGKRENLPEDTKGLDTINRSLLTEEKDFLAKACEGFEDAFSKETFPMCGLDEQTTTYIVAALCAETGRQEDALRWASRLILSKNANDRIKERARHLKEMITSNEI